MREALGYSQYHLAVAGGSAYDVCIGCEVDPPATREVVLTVFNNELGLEDSRRGGGAEALDDSIAKHAGVAFDGCFVES